MPPLKALQQRCNAQNFQKERPVAANKPSAASSRKTHPIQLLNRLRADRRLIEELASRVSDLSINAKDPQGGIEKTVMDIENTPPHA